MRGVLDGVGPRWVRGWATDDEGGAARITIAINGEEQATVTPDMPRPDVGVASVGFHFPTKVPILIGDVISVTSADGRHLLGSPKQVNDVEGGKEAKALALFDRSMQVLEIGPSFSPIAPRSAGWKSYSLDHADKEELKKKYAGVDISKIEDVDFVWRQGSILDAVPLDLYGSFDGLIASHVIEHFPDPIGFFSASATLLREKGLISLVVPDKRMTFDYFKPLTLTSDLLDARRHGLTRHRRKTAFDNIAYNVFESGHLAWSTRGVSDFTFPTPAESLKEAMRIYEGTNEADESTYIDYHHTVYTPSSFELIILELAQLSIIPFEVVLSYPTSSCEFYVTLRKRAVNILERDRLDARRMILLKNTVRELGQQARWLLDE